MSFLLQYIFHLQDEVKSLRAENARLCKAGDEMAKCIDTFRNTTRYSSAIDKLGGFATWFRWNLSLIHI